eukprot:TRINITY_DN47486_c0_g1_i1.p2 TRINITY_DN47486_c0_g1~~TRINITY_DN47486_c0_g1_i1.p2  ORF type:complete len:159 (-),score=27.18 TRINITY_DN47486_c0_g1_i1:174-650(-)
MALSAETCVASPEPCYRDVLFSAPPPLTPYKPPRGPLGRSGAPHGRAGLDEAEKWDAFPAFEALEAPPAVELPPWWLTHVNSVLGGLDSVPDGSRGTLRVVAAADAVAAAGEASGGTGGPVQLEAVRGAEEAFTCSASAARGLPPSSDGGAGDLTSKE